ncbi:MAG: trimethylamine methyltransferase family protein [Phycisphaerae bacterium]|nr:trimethylamine methyltransferase family protein [Phycisphaerae bacterium]
MHPRRIHYRVLSDSDIARLHDASLKILQRTGSVVLDDGGRELLRHAGCTVDGARVFFPAHLVEEAIRSAPKSVTLYSRTGESAMVLEGHRTYYGTGSDCPFTIDINTGLRRETVKQDVVDLARLVDGLANLDFVMCMAIAKDVGRDDSYVHQFAAMMQGTIKPLVFTAHHIGDMIDIHQMASAVAGSPEALAKRPFLLLYSEPIAPLVHTNMGIEKLVYCARHGVPVTYPTGAMCGATAPVTMAGAIALGNAECLAGLVIHQLAKPGAPFVYGGNTTAMDMSAGTFPYAAPEFHLCFSAYADLAHHYNLPVWALAGASDAKVLDAQAGAEAAYEILMAELSGAQLIHDMGYLDSGLTSSAEMIVLADELASMARFISRGIEITDKTLALDVIDEVGAGNNFLTHDHTVKNFREALWFPSLTFRGNIASWEASGRKDMYTRLNERAKAILANRQVPPVPPAAWKKVMEILAKRG